VPDEQNCEVLGGIKMAANRKNRPTVEWKNSRTDLVAEGIALCGLLFGILLLWRYWTSLPESVPQHFGPSGKPDAWGSKQSLLILPALNTIIYVGLTILNRFPRLYNYPWEITPQNAKRQYELARSLVIWLKLGVSYTFSLIVWRTIQVALGKSDGLGSLFMPAVLLLVFVPIGVFVVKAYRAR
jgi:uncharacterized membrane protein